MPTSSIIVDPVLAELWAELAQRPRPFAILRCHALVERTLAELECVIERAFERVVARAEPQWRAARRGYVALLVVVRASPALALGALATLDRLEPLVAPADRALRRRVILEPVAALERVRA
jgi:hypothetical protein